MINIMITSEEINALCLTTKVFNVCPCSSIWRWCQYSYKCINESFCSGWANWHLTNYENGMGEGAFGGIATVLNTCSIALCLTTLSIKGIQCLVPVATSVNLKLK